LQCHIRFSMPTRIISALTILTTVLVVGQACNSQRLLPKIPLPRELTIQLGKTATVAVFLSTKCPMYLQYPLTLKSLSKKFSEHGISFIGVFPEQNSDQFASKKFMRKYALPFSIIIDRNHKITKALGATITPEVFVLDSIGNIYYRGMIDNWYYGLGKKHPNQTIHYVEDCLKALSKQLPAPHVSTKPLGCFIN